MYNIHIRNGIAERQEGREVMKNFIGTKKIHWEYEGKTYTGTVTFTPDGSNIQVTASSDQSTQTFYNEVHSIEDAQIIYGRLAENDWNSEDIL